MLRLGGANQRERAILLTLLAWHSDCSHKGKDETDTSIGRIGRLGHGGCSYCLYQFAPALLIARDRMLRYLMVAPLLALAWCDAATAQVDPEERRIADCIDRFNTDPAFQASAVESIRENPLVILAVRSLAGIKTADGRESFDPYPFGTGAQVDADTLITFAHSGHTRTGLTVGLSGMTYWVPNHSIAYGGELRLGLGRRRWGVPVFEPKLFQLLRPSTCRFERMDLGIDLVRWRVRGLTDLAGSDSSSELISGISLLVPSQRIGFEGWGWKWSLSLLDFGLRPSFHWGASGSLELSLDPLVFGLTLTSHFLPTPHLFGTLSAGLRFEFGEGVGL